ncbi:bifunctional anthranilate synthase component I family protein/class IV aminotransferase [Massilia forsythiae]|uniref:Bifunctional anthranilate synthase component I family protein/class IV aminotransferase n=1 Tax=Massilia forsythiae TaxID=2728020 RepID=A0A7Z2VVG3_9BURK|nr:bifunctional anthranilate synthase component I family protein/class IV aminotransferase [Massilia forsythiae]QJD99960.1 bifunctional anthranilate synthase component I family protein/class IV aminotransferase [Massilia forsythiae]
MQGPVFALLDDAGADGRAQARSRLYRDHAGTLACHDIHAWPQLLAQLEAALARGLYAVPVLAYELGEGLFGMAARSASADPAHPPTPPAPLAQVLLFERYEALDADGVAAWLRERAAAVDQAAGAQGSAPAGIAALRANVGETAFTRAIDAIRAWIAAGDTYQVNYTYRLRFDAFGSVFALYERLRARQPVPYGALIGLPDGRTVLSLSPELFVRHTGGRLLARPMKGTAPAAPDASPDAAAIDAERARALAADTKNRAENLMIVDLLRNDLGKIAVTGSVAVPALFEVNRHGKVLQMTSTVHAQLRPGVTLASLFDALYPCGSITGAPKRRTMEIIRELEPDARGIYTGAIGWIDPPACAGTDAGADPDGAATQMAGAVPVAAARFGDFCLSVPIRTLVLQAPRDGVREGELGVGAGIVHDSDAAAEFAECRLKAGFLTGLANTFELFETMFATREDGCRHLQRHLSRLQASSAYFGYPFDADRTRAAVLDACAALAPGLPHRLRLALRPDGVLDLQSAVLAPLPAAQDQPVRLLLASETTRSGDLLLRHKTSVRSRYDAAWRAAESAGAFDTLFFNERGELTEGGRSNVFVHVDGRWITPALACGVLPGVLRAVLLDDPGWDAVEGVITRAMLQRADAIVVCNALRGPLQAVLAG